MKGCCVGLQDSVLYGASNAVQHMVAVALDKDLHTCRCDFGQKGTHLSLTRRMEVDLGILDQQESIPICRKSSDDDGKHLGQPEAGVYGAVKRRVTGCPDAQGDHIRRWDLL